MQPGNFKHIGLFEGIGGFSLASRWMGWETIAWCEWNPFGQQVLSHHFPKAQKHGDIKTTDFTIYRGKCNILTGGFPCQPYSSAGKRLGKEDDRHLWPEMLRAIREIQPGWVVGENVRGLTNWNGGVVFDEVQADLEAEGYSVLPFLLPACAVNAPHRRDRIWFIAYRTIADTDNAGTDNAGGINGNGAQANEGWQRLSQFEPGKGNEHGLASNAGSDGYEPGRFRENRSANGESEIEQEQRQRIWGNSGRNGQSGATTYSEAVGYKCGPASYKWYTGKLHPYQSREYKKNGCQPVGYSGIISHATSCGRGEEYLKPEQQSIHNTQNIPDWRSFPTEPPICGGNDGLPAELDNITFPKWRNESIKAYGNAIVPQVAFQMFKAIWGYEIYLSQRA